MNKLEALKTALKLIFFTYLGLFLLAKINLVIVDLGRHITNGRVFVERGMVVKTNLYSYTHPDFPVITHHWGVGVIYYLVHKVAGFEGLSILNAFLAALTMFFLYRTVRDKAGFLSFAVAALLFVPLLASRKEIRPENFSYLFVAVFIFLFESYKEGRLKYKVLLPAIFLLQVLWINIHIFFVFGIMITAIYTFTFLIVKKVGVHKWRLITPLFSVVLASLINPFGVKGLLAPFNIFQNYGYMISENQSIIFMQKRYPSFEYFFMELASVAYVVYLVYLVGKRKISTVLPRIIISGIFMVLALRYIRAFPLFAVAVVPLAAMVPKRTGKEMWAVFLLLLFLSFIPGSFFSPFQRGFGMGLGKDSQGSANFFKDSGLSGPVFNNYDIGSYLIYSLYPQEKVFVDNRPEAYPEEFFTEVYVPMQEDEEKWREMKERYGFNVIFFYRRDMTPWAQPFLITRLADPEWVPVYVDDFALILVRNNDLNSGLIERFRLLPEMFVVTKN